MTKERIIIGITGASGALYGIRALQLLQPLSHIETHLVVSSAAYLTCVYEASLAKPALKVLADVTYSIAEVGAAIASGSFKTIGMLVAPCSMRTLSAIAGSASDNLLTRAADVMLKERRRLVLMTREAPLHLGHLRNMIAVTEMGGIIFPPVPAMYQQPQSIDTMVTHSVARALALFGIDIPDLPCWGETLGLDKHN